MKMRLFFVLLMVVMGVTWSARADEHHVYRVASPDHEQTFAYGTEQGRSWMQRSRTLVAIMKFTNDPFVDRNNPRQYDMFFFSFPQVVLDRDGHLFYYRTPKGREIPVAAKTSGFLGIPEIKLLPNAELVVRKPHGYLSLSLEIVDPGF